MLEEQCRQHGRLEMKEQRREMEKTQGEEILATLVHSKLAALSERSHWRSYKTAICPVASPRTEAGRLVSAGNNIERD